MSDTLRELARALLILADVAEMPDSYWATDSRVALARKVLDVPEDGRYSHAYLWEQFGTEGGTTRQGTAQAASVGSAESGAPLQPEVGAE